MTQALGLIEVVGYPTAIEAADAALKASNVRLSEITKVDGGIMTVQLFGDVGAITAAVEAGKVAAERVGSVRSAHVIPRVDESLIGAVIKTKPATKGRVNNEGSVKTVEVDTKEPLQQGINEPLVVNKSDIITAHHVETNEVVENLEHLSKKSNTELRQLIAELGINVSNKKLREAKKAELIRMITEAKR